jgi:hypothetical protein
MRLRRQADIALHRYGSLQRAAVSDFRPIAIRAYSPYPARCRLDLRRPRVAQRLLERRESEGFLQHDESDSSTLETKLGWTLG